MEQNIVLALQRQKRRRIWHKALSFMACVVVFCTTYALILPAITQETDTFCGHEAHTHSEKCMEKELICGFEDAVSDPELSHGEPHVHGESCYQTTDILLCDIPEEEAHHHSDSCTLSEQALICMEPECEPHIHEEACISVDMVISCGQEEHEAHYHGLECYTMETVLSCGTEESEGHTHTGDCEIISRVLSCGSEEYEGHTHTEACQTREMVLSCHTEESAGHSHTEECMITESLLTCGQEEYEGHTHVDECLVTELILVCEEPESEEHTHGADCYIEEISVGCGLEESTGHTHGEDCYTTRTSFICGMEEYPAHYHSDSCYTEMITYSCGMEESAGHSHSDACYRESISYGCGLEESAGHTHSEECYTISYPLICDREETPGHSHSEECYTAITTYLCGLEETPGHTHGEGCYEEILTYTCGVEETDGHTHGDGCFQTVEELICTVTETGPPGDDAADSSEKEVHIHTDECYEEKQVCDLEEHEHTLICYSDPTADLESRSTWESTLPVSLAGDLQKDILAIARSQLGYSESTLNYIVMEDGISTKGYSRYGAWYGDPYGDWCAMFVSFCLDHAGAEKIPLDANCPNWIKSLRKAGLYHEAEGYTPEMADIIFFDWDRDGISDHVGLVAEYIPAGEHSEAQVTTIEGNSGDCVQSLIYELTDPDILGYGTVSWLDGGALSFRGEDYTITVSFGPDAKIPANASLQVRELEQDSEEYQTHYQETLEALQLPKESEMVQEIAFARFFDISFIVNNALIEPETAVDVTIRYDQPVSLPAEDDGMAVHFAEDGIELIDVETDEPPEGEEPCTEQFAFTQDSFSVTGTLVVRQTAVTLAAGPDYSGASNLLDYISSIRVMDGGGAETKVFADGDPFTIVLEGTIHGYQFQDGADKLLKFTLPDAFVLSSFTCTDSASHAALDGDTNSFCMTIPAVYQNWNYQSVTFRVELTGQVVNKTGSTINATIRWDNYQIYGEKKTFTFVMEDGTVVTADLLGSSYSPDAYELVVEQVDESAYQANIQNFVNSQYNRRQLEDVAVYTVYLRNKSSPDQRILLPAPYTLRLSYEESPVTLSSQGRAIMLNMANGTPSKPSGSTVNYGSSGVSSAAISDQYSALGTFAIASIGGISEGTTGSGYSLSYNDQADAFIYDSAYADYYNANSPIGTAGSFHIVAFGTANLDTHTNGNVLANNLYANSNFGTNNYGAELSYVQNYIKVNSNSASKNEHVLVVGSENEIGFYDNNNKYTINGQGLDRPKNLIQDQDTASAPFIDLDRVQAEIRQISANMAGYPDGNLVITKQSQKNIISLKDPHGVGILNVDPSDDSVFGKDYIQLAGFESGNDGSIVINVDCTGYTEIDLPKALIVVDGQEQGTNEVTEFSNGKVLWNFINADGVTINTHLMTGMVIAPGATVNVTQNLNGTVVAENINIKAESHRTDFTGKIIPGDTAIEHYVTIQKTRAGNAGVTLSNAHFDLYMWDGAAWVMAYSDDIITDSGGRFVLEELLADTAYKLVEVEPPPGYILMEEPFYFWISRSGSGTSPVTKPQGFSGLEVTSGSVLTITNEPDETVEQTSIEIQKVWNTDQEITVPRVYVELYQLVWNEGHVVEHVLYKTVTITRALGWKYTVTDLPLTGVDESGNPISYTYAVLERPVEGFTPEYSVDVYSGVTEGVIVITNTPGSIDEGYVLPATGGTGTFHHTFIGFVLMSLALGYLLILPARRRGEDDS